MKEFAAANGMDLKYLVDGANFVISRMHFNPEDNYYLTLGVPENASPEEIRERWKRLMLLYHPDVQVENEEWVSERAKKVNEAYTTLKDPAKRQAYDRRLWEDRQTRVFSAGSQSLHPNHATSRAGSRQRSYENWSMIRRYIPRLLIMLYILGASAFLAFIYYQNRSKPLEDELRPASAVSSQESSVAPAAEAGTALQMKAESRKNDLEIPVAATPTHVVLHSAKETRTEVAKKGRAQPVVLTARKHGQPDKKKARRAEVATVTHIRLRPSPTASYASGAAGIKGRKTKGVKVASGVSSKVLVTAIRKPETVKATAVMEKPRPSVTPKDLRSGGSPVLDQDRITKTEVEDFIKRYSAAYEKGDLKTFMPFFAAFATENNMNYDEIRQSYRETFEEKVRSHHLQHVVIRIEGKTADVSGEYNVVRFLSSRDSWKHYSGTIHWSLARVNGALKIVRSHYGK